MPTYRIENTNGVVFGEFVADDEQMAFELLAISAGYPTYADSCQTNAFMKRDLIITRVDRPKVVVIKPPRRRNWTWWLDRWLRLDDVD